MTWMSQGHTLGLEARIPRSPSGKCLLLGLHFLICPLQYIFHRVHEVLGLNLSSCLLLAV